MLEVATATLEAVGLRDFVIDLGDAGVVRSLLAGVNPEHATAIADAMGRKDAAEVESRAGEAGVEARVLLELLNVTGLDDGVRLLAGTTAAAAASRLSELHSAARARGLGDRITADLGEIRSAAYYTGMLFRAYAKGSPDAIGSGGRYDDLLSQFGRNMPAVGFGIDLDALASAARAARVGAPPRERVLVVGDERKARELRDRGVVAVVRHEADGAEEYATAWGFTKVVS